MNYRLHGFLRFLRRLVLIGLGAGILFLGWRAFLHYGPRGPAMYRFHAKALVRHRAGFPRPAAPVFLPVPQGMSSADVQLRLMNWWDGKRWQPEALAHGESIKGGLQLNTGELELVDVTGVSPPDSKDGVTTCSVSVKVRWAFPEDLQEVLRVKEILALRFTKGLAPGQAGEMTCAFARKGWQWELTSAVSPWGGKLSVPPPSSGPLDWLF